jgi:hypothetical protein
VVRGGEIGVVSWTLVFNFQLFHKSAILIFFSLEEKCLLNLIHGIATDAT